MADVYPAEKKVAGGDNIEVHYDEKGAPVTPGLFPPTEWLERLKAEYQGQHEGEALPAGCDIDRMAVAVLTMQEDESIEYMRGFVVSQKDDYSVDQRMISRFHELIQGHEACGMKEGEWAYEVCKKAGLCHNWSPYAEIRAVTLPYDDYETPCETIRAYFLGYLWVCICTVVNSFFAPRQPGISIPGSVVQLLLVPMGRGLAWVLPDRGITLFGTRYSLNPGPWTAKEQLFATIVFQGASGIGNMTGLLVLRMPTFFNQRWAHFGFNILLALANQVYGLGLAGILRRLTVYPMQAVWPDQLPTLALNRTLIHSESVSEKINGWRISRYRMFVYCLLIFAVYYWIPNQFFQGIRLFNWMTWINPRNLDLAIVTGSYGGMGFNPLSTLDPNASGAQTMDSPFFAQLQQYCMRLIAGVVIIIMYYKNAFWAAYMPINSNAAFDNQRNMYNMSAVLNPGTTNINIEKYNEYGPPYFAIANLFVHGANFIYYTFSIVYVFVKYWPQISKAFVGLVVNTWHRRSIYTGFDDGQTRMMRKYKEVPEWWYGIVFLFGFVVSIVALEAFPTRTPWWSILGVTGVGFVLTIPWVIIESIASTGIQLNVIWQVLPGIWFPGEPLPQLILLMLGAAFEVMAGAFSRDLKFGHYAKIPPRAIFRGHVSAVILNCFIYCAVLELLVVYAGRDSTLCTWSNKYYMVCAYANSVWASTIQFGAFGTNNMFQLYPILPWCFLIGAILGCIWIGVEKAAPYFHDRVQAKIGDEKTSTFDKWFWIPACKTLNTLHPAIALSGALQWAGNNNLTYATLQIYLAFIFQFYLKRRYTAWWGKYAYLIFAGLMVGVAISGLIVTFIFSFGVPDYEMTWWGNRIPRDGLDFALYDSQVALKEIPEKGYFGLDPEDFPQGW